MATKTKVNRLPRIVGRYFDAWIQRSTWHTGHLTDEEYFYRFVKAVLQYCRKRKRPSDRQIRQLIELKGRDTIRDIDLQNEAQRYSSLYANILEFHDTGFPDVLTERTSPLLCYLTLQENCNDESKTAQFMNELFGDEWKAKLEEHKRRSG